MRWYNFIFQLITEKEFKFTFIIFFIFLIFLIIKNNITNDLGIIKIDHIPILAFHKLVPDETKREKYIKNQWVVSIDVYSKMMQWLYINDYKTINTEEFYRWYKGDIEYYNKTVLIIFDDGFYDVYYLVYPILKNYNFKDTSFLVGNRINKETPIYNKSKDWFIGEDIIEKMRREYPNIEFQSHSYNMHFLNKYHKFRINR